MVEKTLNAASNPGLANNLINQALASSETTAEPALVTPPSDTLVNLPGGYITDAGEVIKTAEVRELTGRDEELIAKTTNLGRTFATILSCGTVSIGGMKATEKVLDDLLAGDRDAIMLGIYKATFGPTCTIRSLCKGCGEPKEISITIDEDIRIKTLNDPIVERAFTVKGVKNEYLVSLPTGATSKELSTNLDKTYPELTTILLQGTVLKINGAPVLGKQQILNMSMTDRQKISTEIAERTPGPQFEDLTMDCPDCGGEVVVPINLGTLFRI